MRPVLFGKECAAPRGGKFSTCPCRRPGFHKLKTRGHRSNSFASLKRGRSFSSTVGIVQQLFEPWSQFHRKTVERRRVDQSDVDHAYRQLPPPGRRRRRKFIRCSIGIARRRAMRSSSCRSRSFARVARALRRTDAESPAWRFFAGRRSACLESADLCFPAIGCSKKSMPRTLCQELYARWRLPIPLANGSERSFEDRNDGTIAVAAGSLLTFYDIVERGNEHGEPAHGAGLGPALQAFE